VRWFEYGVFCPVCRLHGERLPHREPIGTSGGGKFFSGAGNEVWSFGPEVYGILRRYLHLRERLRPYVGRLMAEAHEKGSPVIRPLFYDFPEDGRAWETEDEYMFGPDVIVAPVMRENVQKRKVYLPAGRWKDTHTGSPVEGGCELECEAPLDVIPVFVREDSGLDFRI
jgi:alpha-D-xyloside xylohydrolase